MKRNFFIFTIIFNLWCDTNFPPCSTWSPFALLFFWWVGCCSCVFIDYVMTWCLPRAKYEGFFWNCEIFMCNNRTSNKRVCLLDWIDDKAAEQIFFLRFLISFFMIRYVWIGKLDGKNEWMSSMMLEGRREMSEWDRLLRWIELKSRECLFYLWKSFILLQTSCLTFAKIEDWKVKSSLLSLLRSELISFRIIQVMQLARKEESFPSHFWPFSSFVRQS